MLAEGDDDRFFAVAEHCRPRRLRSHWRIAGGSSSLPFDDGLWIDAVTPGERPYALDYFICIARRIACVVLALP